MSKISPKSQLQKTVRQQLNNIMGRLKSNTNPSDFLITNLYNDFLIVSAIINTVPQSIYEELKKQLQLFYSKLKMFSQERSSDSSSEELNLDGIAKVLLKIEKKDVLLDDFLVCGGYYQTAI